MTFPVYAILGWLVFTVIGLVQWHRPGGRATALFGATGAAASAATWLLPHWTGWILLTLATSVWIAAFVRDRAVFRNTGPLIVLVLALAAITAIMIDVFTLAVPSIVIWTLTAAFLFVGGVMTVQAVRQNR